MKTKIKTLPYEKVVSTKRYKHFPPRKPNPVLVGLVKAFSKKELKDTSFSYEEVNMDKISKHEPVLYLMNHSCFLDLKIAYRIIKRRFNIVSTDDGFVGKKWLLWNLGCIPTMKFISDPSLVKDMKFAVKTLHNSILMYPEASYSFDGTATPLPPSIAKIIRLLNIPVVTIETHGAFLHDPLYNNLQLRKVKVSATETCILTKEDIQTKNNEEIFEIINAKFKFDGWQYQKDNHILINEPFRADQINRVLYKCPYCEKESFMEGKGTDITCLKCNAKLTLTEEGFIKALNKEDKFTHVPSWYAWERDCVKNEILNHSYNEVMNVDIYILSNMKAIYKTGKGILTHNENGFTLKGIDNSIDYMQKVEDSYSLYSDYYWYEIGDIVCIGNYKMRYYCVPTDRKDIVAKIRIAAEELYKLKFSTSK